MPSVVAIPGFAEPFSSLSHLVGAAVFAVLSVQLLRQGRGDRSRMISLAVFCFGAVFLLSMSGVYHLLDPENAARPILRRLDHSEIFILIACSFTPTHTILFEGWGRGGMLLLIWTVAVVGIAVKMVYFNEMPRVLGIALYLGMGWLGVFTGVGLWRRYGFSFMQPLLWGGVAYTVGALLEALHWPVLISGVIQWHEVFHVAILIGLAIHWAFVYQIADGRYPAVQPALA